jgi:hypothetical protein
MIPRHILTTMLALAAMAGPLFAHGKGRLKLDSQRLVPGGQVDITGTEFAKNERFTVLLIGAAGRTRLTEVKSDSAGRFQLTVTIPVDLAPGSYRIAMEASDRDLVATANVQIEPGTAMAGAGHTHTEGEEHAHAEGEEHAHAEGEEHADGEPSTEPLELVRARSPLVTGGALFSVLAAFGVGVLLLRKNGVG